MEERKEPKVLISQSALVKVTTMNHIVEVQHMEKMNRTNHIRKLDKDRFLDLNTGEIKEFAHIETRQDSLNSLRQTFKRLRYLINNNFVGKPNELYITFTFAKFMKDEKIFYTDFKKFMMRLKYHYKNISSIDYLSVVEPHESGEWHCHVLMRFNDLDKVFIKHDLLSSIWSHGFIKIKALKDVDNIGAYLSAYLSDVELNDENMIKAMVDESEIVVKEVEGKEKKFVKGGRLHMYPPGMNIYRKSKGIVPPERIEMAFRDVKKIVGSREPHYEKSIHIENDDFENTINYLQYNTKRK